MVDSAPCGLLRLDVAKWTPLDGPCQVTIWVTVSSARSAFFTRSAPGQGCVRAAVPTPVNSDLEPDIVSAGCPNGGFIASGRSSTGSATWGRGVVRRATRWAGHPCRHSVVWRGGTVRPATQGVVHPSVSTAPSS